MTVNLLVCQPSFLDLCPIAATVEASPRGIEESGAIFTRRGVFIARLAGHTAAQAARLEQP